MFCEYLKQLVSKITFFKQIKKLQSLLRENDGNSMCLLNFDPIPLPLDPDIVVKGIVPESATIFKVKFCNNFNKFLLCSFLQLKINFHVTLVNIW